MPNDPAPSVREETGVSTNTTQATYTYCDMMGNEIRPTSVVSNYTNNNSITHQHQTQQHSEVLDTSYHVQSSSSSAVVNRNNIRSEDNQTMYIPTNQYNFNNNSEMPNNLNNNNNISDNSAASWGRQNDDREFENPELVLDQTYSVANSITGSDISSLTNLGTPDSPPRATSPTEEIREILNKIQQLPQQKSPIPIVEQNDMPSSSTTATSKSPPLMMPPIKTQTFLRTKRCFTRNKIKTLYVPLTKQSKTMNLYDASKSCSTKRWLSRSAPTTPCSAMLPTFPSQRKSSANGSRRGSKNGDGSPLLLEQESSDDETRKSEHV